MSTTPAIETAERCGACTAPLAADQRYCLECGEVRQGARRSLPAALRRPAAPAMPAAAAAVRPPGPSQTVVLAGLACLLLAMGVGVLLGRGGRETATPAPITITGAAAGIAAETDQTFTSDWPSGREGWTIALQTLRKDATPPAAVAAAKASAVDKGTAQVGALDSGDYPSLTAGSYVVYSGVYSSRDHAGGALGPLERAFPGATIVHVSKTARPAASASRSTGAEERAKKAFEESKKAPKTLGTGGKPPPKDDKPAAGGGGFEEIG